jgi:hypothetical protein
MSPFGGFWAEKAKNLHFSAIIGGLKASLKGGKMQMAKKTKNCSKFFVTGAWDQPLK